MKTQLFFFLNSTAVEITMNHVEVTAANIMILCELNSPHYVYVIIIYNGNNLGRRGVFIKRFIHY